MSTRCVPGDAPCIGHHGVGAAPFAVDYAWEGGRLAGVTTPVFTAGYTHGAAGTAPTGLQRTVFGLQPAAVADTLAEDLLGRRTSGTSTTRQGQGYGYGYTFDAGGRRAGMTRTDGSSWTFGYDGLDQLASALKSAGAQSGPARTSTYTHDTIGNRTAANLGGTAWTYTPDTLNRYTGWVQGGAAVTPQYDADGNLGYDGTWVYRWDAENRLVGVERPYPDPVRWTYTYDAAWRRIRAVRESSVLGSGVWTRTEERRWAYAGWMPLAEWRDTGAGLALWRTYVWGLDVDGRLQGAGGVGGLLAIHEHAGSPTPTASWLPGWDGNGNAIAWTNGHTGALAATVTTGAFGEPAHVSNTGGVPADVLAWAFSTKPTDPDTGHAYFGYRWYAHSLGRWLSRDPIEEHGGLNLYGMVGNGVVGLVDPLGLSSVPAPDPFDPCSDPCSDLLESIRKLARHVRGRYNDLLLDVKDLYGTRRYGKMSWHGHQQQFGARQTQLEEAIKRYNDRGCGQTQPLPTYVNEEALRRVPERPVRYEMSAFDRWATSLRDDQIPTPGEAFIYGAGGAAAFFSGAWLFGTVGGGATLGGGAALGGGTTLVGGATFVGGAAVAY